MTLTLIRDISRLLPIDKNPNLFLNLPNMFESIDNNIIDNKH